MGYISRWLLLLFLTQMAISINESINNQSQQHSGPGACHMDEYGHLGHCCKTCLPGSHVKKHCMIPHTSGECVPCPRGTYIAHASGLESCLMCKDCRTDQEAVHECSPTSNRLCQCKAGYFSQDAGLSEFCTPCDKCLPEQVLRPCNTTANTVCRAAPPKETNSQYLPLGLGLGLLALLLLLHYCCRHNCWSRLKDCPSLKKYCKHLGYNGRRLEDFTTECAAATDLKLLSVIAEDTNGRKNTNRSSESVSLPKECSSADTLEQVLLTRPMTKREGVSCLRVFRVPVRVPDLGLR